MAAGVRFGAVSEHVLNNSPDPHSTPPPPHHPLHSPRATAIACFLLLGHPWIAPCGAIFHRAMCTVDPHPKCSPWISPVGPSFPTMGTVLANPLWTLRVKN